MNEWYGDLLHCDRRQPFGWRCTRDYHRDGPCALVPRWWNLRDRWRMR